MNISDLIKNTLDELQNLMATRLIVADPIAAGDHTVIPVSKVTFGFGGGGGENSRAKEQTGTGQGIGGGWCIEPVAFVVIGPGGAKLLTIGEKESTVGKLMDLAPKVVETVKEMVEKKGEKKEAEPEPESETTEE
jgi:sporulation protein YtfJ